jgi:hypothetical protein
MSVPGNLYTPTIRKTRGGDYLIEQSLLFNDDDSAYLTRTPSTAGNRKTWTFSAWVKRGNLSSAMRIFFASTASPAAAEDWTNLSFDAGDTLTLANYTTNLRTTSMKFRDPNAWYHLVVAVDTTLATAADRIKIYVNGVQITAFGTNNAPTQNFDFSVNNTVEHKIGERVDVSGDHYDGLMALPILVDGAALDATSFGELDDDGYWNPIEYTGATTLDYINPAITAFIGNMTGNGGLSAISDGSRTYTADTALSPTFTTANAYVGVDWGVGVTNTPTRIVVQNGLVSAVGPSWDGNNSGTINMAIYGSNSAPASYNDGTLLGSKTGITNTNNANLQEVFEGGNLTTTTGYRYHWVHLYSSIPEQVIGEVQFFAESATPGYGTNGFELDYADSSWFGLNVAGNDDQAALSAAAPSATAWLNITGAWTMGSGTASRTTTVNAIRSASVFTGDFSLAVTMASGATGARVGVYAANEDSTFVSSGADSAGLNSMTNSFYANFGAGNFFKGASSTVGVSQTNGAITITRVSGTITINTAGGNHTFAATYTGPMRLVLGGGGATMSYTGIAYTADGQAGNSFFDTGFVAADQLSDTPTDDADLGIGNFATLNPNDNGGGTLSQGNRYFSSGSDKSIRATMSGTEKYQIEFFGYNELMFGLASAACALTGGNHYSDANSFMYYGYNGNKVNTTFTSYGSASTTDSTYVGMTYDPSNGDLRFYLNGTDQGTAFTMDTSVEWYPYIFLGALNQYGLMNFGQTAFEYPISGFTPLATQNFPAPTIADPSLHFNTVLYTGTGATQAITGVGFQPDFVWIKSRTSTYYHRLQDSVRGATKEIYSNASSAEVTDATTLSSFDSDGFTVETQAGYNASLEPYVAWCWKAGGTAVTNTDGSITSSVSVNTEAGFSIVKWTQTNANGTIGHGLSQQPELMHVKSLGSGDNWRSWTAYNGSSHTGSLNENGVFGAPHSSTWNSGQPGASTFPVGTDTATNGGAGSAVAYLWHSVEGFSKFGSYTGNGSADGPFIYTGFRPAFVLTRRVTVSAGSWAIMDNKRNPYNPVNTILFPDLTNADEGPYSYYDIDFVANGFKIRTSNSQYNVSGSVYIFAAYAESPFQGDDGYTQARAR